MVRARVVSLLVLAVGFWLPGSARGQGSLSGIAGVVRDAAGTPVAGVKVEAASDVLIEKVRTVVTDGQGQYKVVDLPAGNYTVTFSAAGMSTVKNVGVELPSAFTATVNGTLQRGSPEQIVTVTGSASQCRAAMPIAQNPISTTC